MTRYLLLLPLCLACDGPGIAGPTTARIGRVGGSNTSAALLGAWRRAIFFLDDFNYSRSSETTYQFAADGTAVRVQVARNHTLGLADILVSAGRWRLEGARLVIDFVSPSPFQVALDMRLVGDQLELGGQLFLRVEE
ncbi:MAG: hypothetical protein IPK85_13125 [Gemmatimonadetes bacterium]|nr:hypothetical protein [Gemmatimonadota bacterium]